jgi:4,5:9,10-diseco-3-hydroxy-5,9,17-trioxoandrosta-1(10),2-diene-4-oate hydrolase
MLPGWGCTAYTFRHNILAFAADGFRVCVVEPPGQGWSDKPDAPSAYTLPALARHVLEILDRLSIRSTPIIGQSLGGGIAIQIALDAPERVQRLALWSPIGFGCTPVVQLGAKLPTALAPVLERAVGPAMVRYALHIVYGRSRRPTQEDVREYSAPISSHGFVRAQIELLRNVRWTPISSEERARLTLPTAIMTGTEDRLVSYRCLADAAETLPNCRLFVVEGGGHASNETHPDEVNRETLGFLRVPGTMPTS